MIQSRKLKAMIAIAISLSALLLAASINVKGQEKGGQLIIAITADPKSLSPALSPTGVDVVAGHNMFNALKYTDRAGNVMPELAESWDTSADQKTITFHLVRNATWHDGVPFTSADVKFSLENISFQYNSLCKSNIAPYVESIEIPDNYTVVMNLKKPCPGLWELYAGLGGAASSISPKHLYENTDILNNPHNLAPIGTGPFKFVEYVKGSYIKLERNDNYWKGGLPYLDTIIYKIIPDQTARVMAFETGEVDAILYPGLPAMEVAGLKAALPNATIDFYQHPSGSSDRLVFNLRVTPLNDLRVRRAIGMAIDQQAMLDLVFYGNGGEKATGLVSGPNTSFSAWYFNPDAKQPTYNQTASEILLDQAGYPRGNGGKRFNTSIWITTAYPGHDKEAALIKDDLADVGIDVEIKRGEDAAFHDAVFKRWDFDMCIISTSTYPPGLASLFYASSRIERISWANNMGYNNSRVDYLLTAQATEMNLTKRAEYLKEMQQILVDDLPSFMMIWKMAPLAVSGNFGGPADVWVIGADTAEMRMDRVYDKRIQATLVQGIPVEWIAVIVVAAVAIIIAAALLIRRMRKRK